jgi:hypothetical protein
MENLDSWTDGKMVSPKTPNGQMVLLMDNGHLMNSGLKPHLMHNF